MQRFASATLGESVRSRRLDAGMSRRTLSDRSGVSERTICHVEVGGNPRLDVIERIAAGLGTSVHELIRPPAACAAVEPAELEAPA